jgi:hypothetical protein
MRQHTLIDRAYLTGKEVTGNEKENRGEDQRLNTGMERPGQDSWRVPEKK